MTRLFKRHIAAVFLTTMFILTTLIAASRSEGLEASALASPNPDMTRDIDVGDVKEEDPAEKPDPASLEDEEEGTADGRWAAYDNHCESFTVVEGTKLIRNRRGEHVYPVHHRRNRYKRSRADQRRTRELVRLVAKEMGANREGQYLVDMIAYHESTWNPEAIHILNGDLDANQKAWKRHSYSPARERDLEYRLKRADARSKAFWNVKAALSDIRLYKNNKHWDDRLEYIHQIPERTYRGKKTPSSQWKDQRSVWAFGYGLYGMNAVLYTHVIARDAPPWVLCADEGIVATVAAIWALREQQASCAYLSQKDSAKYGHDGSSVRGIVRRWGAGTCGKGKPGKAWQRVMADVAQDLAKRDVNFTWETVPDLGEDFPRYEMVKRGGKLRYKKDENGRRIRTDPLAVIEHMRVKAAEAGLLRPEPLKRKTPGTEPVIVARR